MVVSALVACQSADQQKISFEEREKMLKDSANFTTIEWLDSTFIDLGQVKKGQVVEVPFHFRNAGSKNLVIGKVQPGCGCTVADTPKEPFAPGKEGVIKASFDSKGQNEGEHLKTVIVTANTLPSNTHELHFKVNITN